MENYFGKFILAKMYVGKFILTKMYVNKKNVDLKCRSRNMWILT